MASNEYDNYFTDGNGYKAHWSWLNKHINVLGEQSRGINFQINGYALLSDPYGTLRQFYNQAFPHSDTVPADEGILGLKQAWANLDLIKYFRCNEYPEVPQQWDEFVYGQHLSKGPYLIFENPNKQDDLLQYVPDASKRLMPYDTATYLNALKNPGKYMFKNIVGKANIDFIEQFATDSERKLYRDGSTVEITYDLEPSQFYNVFPNVSNSKITNKFNFFIDGVVFFGQAYNEMNVDHTAQSNIEDSVPIAIMLYELENENPRPEMCFGYEFDYVIHEKIALSMNMLDEIQMKFDELPIEINKESLDDWKDYVGNFTRVNDGVETVKRFVVQDNAIIQANMSDRNWTYEWEWLEAHNLAPQNTTFTEFMDLTDDEKLELIDSIVISVTTNKFSSYIKSIKNIVNNWETKNQWKRPFNWSEIYAWCNSTDHFVPLSISESKFINMQPAERMEYISKKLSSVSPAGADVTWMQAWIDIFNARGVAWDTSIIDDMGNAVVSVWDYCNENGIPFEDEMDLDKFMEMTVDSRITYLESIISELPSEDDERALISHLQYVKEDSTTMVTTNRLYYSDENVSNEYNQTFGTPARVTVMTEADPGVKHTQLLIGNEKVVKPTDTTIGYETVWGGVAETFYTQNATHESFDVPFDAPESAADDDVLAFDFFGEKAPAVNIFSRGTQYVKNPSNGWGANIGSVNSFASTGAVNIASSDIENGVNKSIVIQSANVKVTSNDDDVNSQNGGTFIVNTNNVDITKNDNTNQHIALFNVNNSSFETIDGTGIAAFNSDGLKTEDDTSRVFAVNAIKMNTWKNSTIKGSTAVATFGPAFVQNASNAFVAGSYNQIKGNGYYSNSTILGSYNVIKGDNSAQYNIIEIGKKLTNDHLQQDYDSSLTPTIILGVNNKPYTQCYNRTSKTKVPYTYQKIISNKGVTQILQSAGVSTIKNIKGVKGVKGLAGKTLNEYIKQTADALQIPLLGTAYQTVIDSQYTPSALKQIVVGGAIPINTDHNIGYNVTTVNGETKHISWLSKYNMAEFAVNCRAPYDTAMTMYDAVGRMTDYTSRGINIGLINNRTQLAFDDYDYKSMGSIVWAKLYALLNKLRIDMDYKSYKGLPYLAGYDTKGLKGLEGINGYGGMYHVIYDTSLSDAGDLLGSIAVNKSLAKMVDNSYESKDIDYFYTSDRNTIN